MRAILLICLLALSQIISADEYQQVAPENLVKMELDSGLVLIQLAPDIAPKHVAQFKSLLKEGKYDGKSFYRVIEGFVAQGGLENDKDVASLPIEAEFPYVPEDFTKVQEADLFAPVTGFMEGFAAAADPDKQQAWLTHCPGTIAMARGTDANSATSDFYIVIGQAPRYLDRIMTVFGRVVFGFDKVQQIKRGKSSANGIIQDKEKRTHIKQMTLVTDLDKTLQPKVEVLKTAGEAFATRIASRKHRSHAFFFKTPPAVLDVCQIPLPVKVNGQLN
ncbi:MAG: peptidylprolyl isomerase [Aestuariibacter sp.]